MNHSMPCPLCESESNQLYSLKADYIVKKLEKYYQEKLPNNLEVSDYEMLRCQRCLLEYASPLKSGSDLFYQWVTNHSGYYPDLRWEWLQLIEILKEVNSGSIQILEIGCGVGKFIELAQKVPNVKAVGLDTTNDSVAKCHARGLEVYCETIESFVRNTSYEKQSFDFIVAFHCLEHLSNPKGFVAEMLSLLKQNGRIFLSTPYSPMSFETVWFDPLNHPPHHLTRWNASSYNELAKQLNLQLRLLLPDADKIIDRVINALNLAWNGSAKMRSRRDMIMAVLLNPIIFFKECIRQMQREKINNRTTADVVLVELKLR